MKTKKNIADFLTSGRKEISRDNINYIRDLRDMSERFARVSAMCGVLKEVTGTDLSRTSGACRRIREFIKALDDRAKQYCIEGEWKSVFAKELQYWNDRVANMELLVKVEMNKSDTLSRFFDSIGYHMLKNIEYRMTDDEAVGLVLDCYKKWGTEAE